MVRVSGEPDKASDENCRKEGWKLLSYRLLKNHAGILLIGDYTSLSWLHEVVHDVNERSPLVRDKEGMFLSLA